MKYLNSKVSIIGIFFAATSILVLYLLSTRWKIYLPAIVFWGAVTLMLGCIIHQSFNIELDTSYPKAVLLQILVTCFVFHLIYQIPYYGLRGSDVYIDMASVKGILSSGFVMGDRRYITEGSYFPMIHVFGAMLSMITGIDLFSVVKWFPSLLDLALILLLYLLVRSIFQEEKIALLSTLLFACLQHHILFSSLFIRESIALVLAVSCLYLYFSTRRCPHPAIKRVLAMGCLIGTVFSHHLTSLMLLIFLLIHLLVTKASEVPTLKRVCFSDNILGKKVTTAFPSIAFVALFGYWIYVVTSPLYTLVTFGRSLFSPSEWGLRTYAEIIGIGAIRTIRGHIIVYGFYSFHLIFAVILLYGLLQIARNRRLEIYSFALYLFLCGLVGLASLYLIAPAAFPDRFLMFGWLFGFPPLVATILKWKHKSSRRVGGCLLLTFLLFNIYMIEPTAWDPKAEGIPAATSEEDYALANTFDFSSGEIFGPRNIIMAIYDVHNNLGIRYSLFEKIDLIKFDWVIIGKEHLELEKKYYRETEKTLSTLARECSADYNKIYESNNLLVFKR